MSIDRKAEKTQLITNLFPPPPPIYKKKGLRHYGRTSSIISNYSTVDTYHKYFPPRLAAEADFVFTSAYTVLSLRYIRFSFLDNISLFLIFLVFLNAVLLPKLVLTLFERSQYIPPYLSSFVNRPISGSLFFSSILLRLTIAVISNVL